MATTLKTTTTKQTAKARDLAKELTNNIDNVASANANYDWQKNYDYGTTANTSYMNQALKNDLDAQFSGLSQDQLNSIFETTVNMRNQRGSYADLVAAGETDKLKLQSAKGTDALIEYFNYKPESVSGSKQVQAFDSFGYNSQHTAAANEALALINKRQTQYTNAVADAYNKYANRDKFSYDMNTDPMFQNYLANMARSGQSAMQNTMGQAAALTGGYGSSYAVSAGSQAYNAYLDQAYDNVTDYYQMALNAYNMEGDALLNQFNMISQMDATEYDRYLQSFDANMRADDQAFNQQYATYNTNKDNYYQAADLQYKYDALAQNQNQFNANMQFNQAQFDRNNYESDRNFEYNKEINDRDFNYAKDIDERNYNYKVEMDGKEYDLDLAKLKAQIDQNNANNAIDWARVEETIRANKAGEALDAKKLQATIDQNNKGNAIDWAKIELGKAELNLDKQKLDADYAIKAQQAMSSGSSTSGNYSAFDSKAKADALATFKSYGYGVDESGKVNENGLQAWVNAHPEYDYKEVVDYVTSVSIPYADRNYQIADRRGLTGERNLISDGMGNVHTPDEWRNLIAQDLIDSGVPKAAAQSQADRFVEDLKKRL